MLFFLDEILDGFADAHVALLGAIAEKPRQDILQIDVHLLDSIGCELERGDALLHVELNDLFVELARTELLTKFLASALR